MTLTAAQIAEILAFAPESDDVTTTVLHTLAVADREPVTPAAAAYDMAGWTTVANERARRAGKRATRSRIGAAGCIDGLITIRTADGPELTACTSPCCTQES